MSSRLAWLIPALCAFSILASCAEGAPAAPPDQMRADSTLGQPKAVCGDGMKDKDEQCDCPVTTSTMCMVPAEVTCAALAMGTGPVYCAAQTCTFVTEMCSKPTNGIGGSGAAGQGS